MFPYVSKLRASSLKGFFLMHVFFCVYECKSTIKVNQYPYLVVVFFLYRRWWTMEKAIGPLLGCTKSAKSKWTQRYLFPSKMEAGSNWVGVYFLHWSYWLTYLVCVRVWVRVRVTILKHAKCPYLILSTFKPCTKCIVFPLSCMIHGTTIPETQPTTWNKMINLYKCK